MPNQLCWLLFPYVIQKKIIVHLVMIVRCIHIKEGKAFNMDVSIKTRSCLL